ncbi:MAG: hypothetical protein FJW95_00560 [Actinobacteria bacterium]|nr:hypothetical protein [Actinomycetota bacterium]
MRVFVVTQNEPLYAPRYLEAIVESTNHDLVGVTALPAGGKRGFAHLVRQRLAIYGPVDFVRAGYHFTRCRLSGSVSKVAASRGIRVVPCTDVNDVEFIAAVRDLDTDVLVSIAANQRFGPALLATPRVAAVNLHSSLLPKHRGLDGLFWALAAGDTTVGVSAHLMTANFDEGAILGQTPFPVPPGASLHQMYGLAISHGAPLLERVLDDLAAGTVDARPNDPAAGNYNSWPTPDAVREFRRRGYRFF